MITESSVISPTSKRTPTRLLSEVNTSSRRHEIFLTTEKKPLNPTGALPKSFLLNDHSTSKWFNDSLQWEVVDHVDEAPAISQAP